MTVAVVTGAGRGIGRAEALALAARGMKVVVNDVGSSADGSGADASLAQQVVDEITAAGGTAVANHDDVGSWEGGAAIVQQAIDTWGRLDVLVNNAGFLRDAMSFNLDESAWDSVIRVHLKGHAATCRAAGRHWRERSKAGEEVHGRIINTTSEAGLYGNPGQLNYVAAKAGIAAMTISLARELGRYGVTANAIAPRARTRMTEEVLGGIEARPGEFDEWDPANIAPVVAWLASDAAAGISGQVFVVFANRLHLMTGWSLASTVETEGAWTVDALTQRAGELFGERGSGVPQMGFGA